MKLEWTESARRESCAVMLYKMIEAMMDTTCAVMLYKMIEAMYGYHMCSNAVQDD
jgi:hypothetical protein